MALPQILSSREMPVEEAKWITLKKITYSDADGKQRVWETAERKTRKSSGIDAVAVLALLKSKKDSFPISTVIIEQYRPPVDKFVVELPAGLIDEGETAENAAMRELQEETGFQADRVIETSPIIVSDPGMTNANMKLVVVGVTFPDKLELSEAKLEDGEHIVKRIVALSDLTKELKVYATKVWDVHALKEFPEFRQTQGFIVDARLSHFASGYDIAQRINGGNFF